MSSSRCDRLPGTRVGRWTVLQEAEPRGKVRHYRCRCDCGSERVYSGYYLLAGRTASCGCDRDSPAQQIPAGTRYGRWTVVGPARKRNHRYWLPCRCTCGAEATVAYGKLSRGDSPQCRACAKYAAWRHGGCRDGTFTPEYRAWAGMRARCRRAGLPLSPRCEVFDQFLEEVGPRPSPHHRLRRRDPEDGFTGENCHWALVRCRPDAPAASPAVGGVFQVRAEASGELLATFRAADFPKRERGAQ